MRDCTQMDDPCQLARSKRGIRASKYREHRAQEPKKRTLMLMPGPRRCRCMRASSFGVLAESSCVMNDIAKPS